MVRPLACLILTIGASLAVAPTGTASPDRDGSRLITALLVAPLPSIYHEDGAADGTMTALATDDPSRQDAPPEVRAILELGPRAIPLLVKHLDDPRLTNARFDGGRFGRQLIRVPLAYVCLDILTHVVEYRDPIWVEDCFDDGLGACIRQGYYFRPDAFATSRDSKRVPGTVRRAKANWTRAYARGMLQFRYPPWLSYG